MQYKTEKAEGLLVMSYHASDQELWVNVLTHTNVTRLADTHGGMLELMRTLSLTAPKGSCEKLLAKSPATLPHNVKDVHHPVSPSAIFPLPRHAQNLHNLDKIDRTRGTNLALPLMPRAGALRSVSCRRTCRHVHIGPEGFRGPMSPKDSAGRTILRPQ